MMQIFLVLELKQHGLVEHPMEFVRVVLGGLASPTTLWKGPEAPWSQKKSTILGRESRLYKGH